MAQSGGGGTCASCSACVYTQCATRRRLAEWGCIASQLGEQLLLVSVRYIYCAAASDFHCTCAALGQRREIEIDEDRAREGGGRGYQPTVARARGEASLRSLLRSRCERCISWARMDIDEFSIRRFLFYRCRYGECGPTKIENALVYFCPRTMTRLAVN